MAALDIPGGNPSPLGRITVAASGTPEPLNDNFGDLDHADAIKNHTNLARWIFVQANPSNTGLCYVGIAGMDISDGTGVLGILAVGGSFSMRISDTGNSLNINDFYVDADNSSDWVIAVMAGL